MSLEKEIDKVVQKLDTAEDHLGIVITAAEEINKGNTSSKADNIDRGINDAKKVRGILEVLKAVLSVFKKNSRGI